MSIQILESKNPVDLSEIEMIEDQLGAHLPGAYREFLLEHNGGYPNLIAFLLLGMTN